MSGVEKMQRKYGMDPGHGGFGRAFDFRPSQLVVALALIVVGAACIAALESTKLIIGGKNFTSIGLLLGGIVYYSGVLVIVAMFRNETYLSIALLLPSVVAVAIFVYGFIGWSVRVSLSNWQGLLPDYSWAGFAQYYNLFNHDQRFLIDVLNTADAVFWQNTRAYIGSVLVSLGVSILMAAAVTTLTRSLAAGLSIAIAWFPVDNFSILLLILGDRLTGWDFWSLVSGDFLGLNLNQMPAVVLTDPRLSAIGSFLVPLVPVTGAHTMLVAGIYAAIFIVALVALTVIPDVKE